jgi:hypothetical protein
MPGNIFQEPHFIRSVEEGITASTTQTQGQRPLSNDINVVEVVANGDDVVTLPPNPLGKTIVIFNNGANNMDVFPSLGVEIDGGGANNAETLNTTLKQIYCGISNTQWLTVI